MLIRANAAKIPLRDGSVQTCVTSPPYYGLRDYKLPPTIWGGDPRCAHAWDIEDLATEIGRGNWAQGVNGRGEEQPGGVDAKREPVRAVAQRGTCSSCGAWSGALGLEPSVELYVEHMVDVFREVRRVLRDDGTLWLNIGDSYCGAPGGIQGKNGQRASRSFTARIDAHKRGADLKPKDLIGVPWALAFALRRDGWYLRQECIWEKRNPQPESVKDRPTRAHEQVFLLAKSPTYYYDGDAVKEPCTGTAKSRGHGVNPKASTGAPGSKQNADWSASVRGVVEQRTMRTVWSIASTPWPGAHYATFPPDLAKRCVLSGAPLGGIVLDPFVGSGTTVRVARDLGRVGIGLDLSGAYLHEQAAQRICTTQGLALGSA